VDKGIENVRLMSGTILLVFFKEKALKKISVAFFSSIRAQKFRFSFHFRDSPLK